MTTLLHKELTKEIIKIYYLVYNKLSQTYPEFIYERAMIALLRRYGIHCVSQDEYQIKYKGRIVAGQRLDLFIADKVIVELKVANWISPIHLAQLLSYLKAFKKEVGLLFCFGGPEPDFARRVLTSQKKVEKASSSKPLDLGAQLQTTNALLQQSNWLYPELTSEIIGGLFEVFNHLGPGFIYRAYANACFVELKLRGLDVTPRKEFRVFLDDIDLGTTKLAHIQIDDRVLLFPVAISDVTRFEIENIKAWMRYLNIPLGILVNFKATELHPIILRV